MVALFEVKDCHAGSLGPYYDNILIYCHLCLKCLVALGFSISIGSVVNTDPSSSFGRSLVMVDNRCLPGEWLV